MEETCFRTEDSVGRLGIVLLLRCVPQAHLQCMRVMLALIEITGRESRFASLRLSHVHAVRRFPHCRRDGACARSRRRPSTRSCARPPSPARNQLIRLVCADRRLLCGAYRSLHRRPGYRADRSPRFRQRKNRHRRCSARDRSPRRRRSQLCLHCSSRSRGRRLPCQRPRSANRSTSNRQLQTAASFKRPGCRSARDAVAQAGCSLRRPQSRAHLLRNSE